MLTNGVKWPWLENQIKNKDMETPLYKKMNCWKGYEPKGKKKSPSGKKTASGKTKMVNNCVKK